MRTSSFAAILFLVISMVDAMTERTAWPHLVGKTSEEAKSEILKDNPAFHVVVVPEGSMVTYAFSHAPPHPPRMDFRLDRSPPPSCVSHPPASAFSWIPKIVS